jgi:ribonuclease HI
MKNNLTSGSACLDQEPAANAIGRKRPERLTKTMATTSRYIRTDRRWETKKDMLSSKKSTRSRKESYLKTRCSVRSSVQLLDVTQLEKNSTIMAAESRTPTKNPTKTQTIRKMLDQEGPRTTLLWVSSHKGMPGNEKVDQAA